jgi:hypothetical protein
MQQRILELSTEYNLKKNIKYYNITLKLIELMNVKIISRSTKFINNVKIMINSLCDQCIMLMKSENNETFFKISINCVIDDFNFNLRDLSRKHKMHVYITNDLQLKIKKVIT